MSDHTQRHPLATAWGTFNCILGFVAAVITGFNAWHTIAAVQEAVTRQMIGPQAFMDAWHALVLTCGFVGAVILTFAGWGMARKRRWGRIVAAVFGMFGLGAAIALAIGGLRRMAPMLEQMESALPGDVPGTVYEALGLALVWGAWPAIILVWVCWPRRSGKGDEEEACEESRAATG